MDSVERDERVSEHFSDRGEVYEKIDSKKPLQGIRTDSITEDVKKVSDSSHYLSGRDGGYDDYDEDDDDPIRDDESLDDDNVNIRPEDDDDE
jgi:hypothetical protein